MTKKVVKKSPRKTKSPNLVIPILSGSVLATLGIALYLNRPRPVPLNINEVSVAPTCTNYVSGPNFSKATLSPGEKFTYSCAFNLPDLNCNYGAVSTPKNIENSKWLSNNADKKTLNFEANAPRIPGTYTAYCQLGNTPECVAKGVTACQAKDKSFTYTVTGTPIAKPTGINYQCLDNAKKVKITWDNTSTIGYLPRLDNLSNNDTGKLWNSDATDLNGASQTSNYLERDILPNTNYSFWLNAEGPGNVTSDSAGVQFICSNLTCQDGFTTDFNSSSLSTQLKMTATSPDSVELANNQVVFTDTDNESNWPRIRTTKEYQGDFKANINIISMTPLTTGKNTNVTIVANNNTIPRKQVFVYVNDKNEIFGWTSTNGVKDVGSDIKTSLDSANLAELSLSRKGSEFPVIYKLKSGEEKRAFTIPGFSGQAEIIFGGDQGKVTIDNFSLSCIAPAKPPTPANPRSTCNPDGKSVRLMWDTVDGSQSYKVRVDDKAGKVLSFDNIGKGEYIATINPGTTYSWWTHASKDGVDSNETSRLEFKCTATTTPTPTPKPASPTIKPTPKPTVEPTPDSSRAPTNPSYVDPSTTTQKIALPIEPSATPAPTKSTNPIARFFTWLASLFE